MSRGRPRKIDPSMPAHIDARRLPKRCYWDVRTLSWYTIINDPKARRQRIADAKATLADLHRILEGIAGIERDTVAWLLDEYHDSMAFKALASSTRKQFEKLQRTAKAIKTRAGDFGTLPLARLSSAGMLTMLENVAKGSKRDDAGELVATPTKANHLLRYLRIAFAWGMPREKCASNPFVGIRQFKERKLRRLPDAALLAALTTFARDRGERKAHTLGSCAPYLWLVIEIGYLCRLRAIETITLTEAAIKADGLETNRRKGSRDSLVTWNPRLRAAVDAVIALRKRMTPKDAATQIKPQDRRLFVAQGGGALSKDGLDTAWQRLVHMAIKEGVLTAEQRFGLHDLKRKGITDTAGTRGEKQLASGHKSEAMLDVYDHSVPAVKPAGE